MPPLGTKHSEETRAKMRAAAARRSRTKGKHRVCARCERWFPASRAFFHKRSGSEDGLGIYCKSCASEVNRRNRQARPEWYREQNLKRRFGITIAEYDQLLASQDGGCAVCGASPSSRRLAVDHNHETGDVRGLLCRGCNTAIGNAEDDPERLRRAAEYLERML